MNDDVYKKSAERRISFVKNVLPQNGIGAELGVMKGHFSPILLKYSNATKLHLLDPWYFLAGAWPWAKGNKSTVDALINILKKFKKEIENSQVVVHVGDDLKTLHQFPDNYLDWVYIDSSHAYEHTKQELEILSRKVKFNGIISGDDWRPDPEHKHHGVYKAVNEFVSASEYKIIYTDSNLQWAISRS